MLFRRGCGEIGRRAGLKIRFRKECRFEPDHPHQPSKHLSDVALSDSGSHAIDSGTTFAPVERPVGRDGNPQ